MLKKISFVIIFNIILLTFIELSVRFLLKMSNLPLVYKTSNIGDNRYDFLTGYYNLPNQKEVLKDNDYLQGTDKYGFNLDGVRNADKLEKKKKNVFRIFIIGGSTVQGRNLQNKFDPISARLEKKLNKNLNFKKNFIVINAGTTSFISSQELGMIQNRIMYSLKPDLIIILNGSNDNAIGLGKDLYLSNSHVYQRNFYFSVNKNSKSFFYFFDDFLSKNISTYFLFKKVVEKSTGIFLFEKDERLYSKISHSIEKKVYRYLYNMKILSKISQKETPIMVYFQPQMLPRNFSKLSESDKLIYENFQKTKPNYFKEKQTFFENISQEIENNNIFFKNPYFHFFDISQILEDNISNSSYYSDHVHYNALSRDVISEKMFEDITSKILKKK